MIDFEPDVENPRLLRRAVKSASTSRDHIPSLSALAPHQSLEELKDLGRSWQKAGFGRMIETSIDGAQSVIFSLNENAVDAVAQMSSQSLMGRLRAIPRSDWIALIALIVSVIAILKPSH